MIEKQRNILFDRRQDALLSEDSALKEYALFQHDLRWSHYLADIADVREGIHWQRMAGRNPLQEFYKHADELSPADDGADLDEWISNASAIDAAAELNVKRPSSTWTLPGER